MTKGDTAARCCSVHLRCEPDAHGAEVRQLTMALASAMDMRPRQGHGQGLRKRSGPMCTLSQNGYGIEGPTPTVFVARTPKEDWPSPTETCSSVLVHAPETTADIRMAPR